MVSDVKFTGAEIKYLKTTNNIDLDNLRLNYNESLVERIRVILRDRTKEIIEYNKTKCYIFCFPCLLVYSQCDSVSKCPLNWFQTNSETNEELIIKDIGTKLNLIVLEYMSSKDKTKKKKTFKRIEEIGRKITHNDGRVETIYNIGYLRDNKGIRVSD